MTESLKTTLFVATALVLALVAYFTSPAYRESKESLTQQSPYKNVEPEKIARLEIVPPDGNVFRIELAGDQWVIPSHSYYPADPKERLAKTAGAISGVVLESIAAETEDLHAKMGVLDPETPRSTDEKTSPEAVGTRVKIFSQDNPNAAVADLVVGKEVQDKPGYRYVRLANDDKVRDTVYVANLENLDATTKFSDWIDAKLIPSGNATKVEILEKSAESGQFAPTVTLTKEDFKWALPGLQEGETTNESKASTLVSNIQGLQIVDARSVPHILASTDDPREQQVVQINRGVVEDFGFSINKQGVIDSKSNNVVLEHDDGLVYTLHVGNTRPKTKPDVAKKVEGAGGEPAKADSKKEAGPTDDAGQQDSTKEESSKAEEERYLVVSVAFDESRIPAVKKPEILESAPAPAETSEPKVETPPPAEPAPPSPPIDPAPSEPMPPATSAVPTNPPPPAETPAPAETPPPASPDGLFNAAFQEADPKATTDPPAPPAEQAKPPAETTAPAQPSAAASPPAETPADPGQPAQPPTESEPPQEAEKAAVEDPAKAAEEAQKLADEQAKKAAEEAEAAKRKLQEIESAKKRYEADLKAREEKVNAGPDKAKKLQEKYSKWIYLVSNEKIAEILIKREDLVTKPEPPATPEPNAGAEPNIDPMNPAPKEKTKEETPSAPVDAPAPTEEAKPETPAPPPDTSPSPPAETPKPAAEPTPSPTEKPNPSATP